MSKRKWNWNFEFFRQRTETVAYWSGFLMADGGLNRAGKNSWCLSLVMQTNDEKHLRDFCRAIDYPEDAIFIQKASPHEIQEDGITRIVSGGESVGVHVTGMNLGDDLLFWGIVPRKTYNFIPPNIPDNLLPHYLRGWADGDGQIYAMGRGARFTVSGSYSSMRWYADALRRLGYSGNIGFQDRNENSSILYIGGISQTKRVIDLLCYENCFRLERKWNTSYEPNITLYVSNCEVCGKEFGVPKFRHEHLTHGRFCSKECANVAQKKVVVDGKTQCSRCKEWFSEMSGNKSYCKSCWRDKAREYRNRK